MNEYTGFEIAVIGISARFPGAKNKDEFWNNLSKGVESIEFFSDEVLLSEGEDIANLKNPAYVKANAYLKDKENFDSAFFGYTPDEAGLMDPQSRILHECVWEAIEDAGYDVYNCKTRIGLFSGATANPNWRNYASIMNLKKLVDDFSLSHLSDFNFGNTKISYLLDLKGPSVTINTACSTSLVAIHQACNSLLLGECGMAAAGGVTLTNYSKKGYLYEEGMIKSENGHCHAFDACATGTVCGEGAGIVVLKRLKKAIEDNDNIYAIIKGTGISNDGRNKVGYTAPGVDGQTEAIMMARKMAKVPAVSITYVEAHGTGTKLGDPIEVEALARAFGKSEEKYCALGSVKTNIGHTDAAAGIAGFIKTVLAIKHKQIPPSLNFKAPNPRIEFLGTPFYVNTTLKDWINDKYPLRAGVSSFGIGGTNAHMILEEAPAIQSSSASRSHQLLVFSAKTETALQKNVSNVAQYLALHEETKLSDLAFTLQLGRASFPYRKMIVCSSRQEAIDNLSVAELKGGYVDMKRGHSVVFMFPGQGSQYANMCYDIYISEDSFRADVDVCFQIVEDISGVDLKRVIFSTDESAINQTQFTQPALFVVEYALARLLMRWGIKPHVMIGHSIGEYVAACISGVFSLKDVLSIVLKRGELMQRVRRGIMLSISLSEEKLKVMLKSYPSISLAAVNSAELCVVSGPEDEIIAFQAEVEKAGVRSKVIRTSHAFHSHMMNDILDEFEREVGSYKINSIGIPFISNLTGQAATDEEISSPKYWSKHLRDTVRFSAGAEGLLQEKNDIFIEVGPGNTLSTFVRSNKGVDRRHKIVELVRRANEPGKDDYNLISALGKLWLSGIEPDWRNYYANERRNRVALPAYAFDAFKYPVKVDSFSLVSEMMSEKPSHKSYKRNISDWYYCPTWKLSPDVVSGGKAPAGLCYLIFTDSMGVGDSLYRRLFQNGEKVVRVQIGGDTGDRPSDAYVLDPGNADGYADLFERLSMQGMIPNRIIHCWNIAEVKDDNVLPQVFSRYLNVFYFSMIHVVKALLKFGGISDKEFVVLSDGLYDVIDGKPSHPIKSLITGLTKVLPQEHPSVQCMHIDISLAEVSEALEEKLVYEISHFQNGDVVTLRNARRWVLVYDNVVPGAITSFRQDGVYLITGGLGELGFHLGKNLVTKYKAKLILLGRTDLPPRAMWDNIVEGSEKNDSLPIKIKRLRELEWHGTVIHYHSCNIGCADALEDIVRKSEKVLGPVNGVIHTAGIVGEDTKKGISELGEEDSLIQFEPKIEGLNSLKTVFNSRKLDFCLLTSSLSSILGGLGFGAYASANAYMDSFTRIGRAKGQLSNWISVNLDGLNFSGTRSSAIDADELFQAVELAVSMKAVPQVIISPTDLGKRMATWITKTAVQQDASNESSRPAEVFQKEISDVEESLLLVWQSFFGKTDIEINDNFFEIGGDSLKALTMIERIRNTLNVELSAKVFFENPSVKELADHIKAFQVVKKDESNHIPVRKVEKKKYYLASSAQERMLYEQMAFNDSVINNISRVFTVVGHVDIDRLKQTFQLLINRHDGLRTSIEIDGRDIVQRVHDNIPFHLTILNRDNYQSASEAANDFNYPFDLSKPPLLRCGLLLDPEKGNFLLIVTHHVVCDAISINVLMNEFIDIYDGRALKPLEFRYVDYSFWQKNQNSYIARQREFWTKQLSGALPRINLPTLRDRDAVKIYDGARLVYRFSKTQSRSMKKSASKENVSDFMFMLTVFYIFLNKVTTESDIIVGTDAVGTTRTEFNSIVGSFINALPLRMQVLDQMSFLELLSKVKACVLEALENQDFQYDEMSQLLDRERKRRIIDVYFSYTNDFDNAAKFDALGFIPFDVDNSRVTTRYELELNLRENGDEFVLTFLYSTDLYDEETISLFLGYFLSILSMILDDSRVLIQDIKLEDFMKQGNTGVTYATL